MEIYLVGGATPESRELLDQPFLQELGPGDAQALMALKDLAWKPAAFAQVLKHPTFSARGITDEWTSHRLHPWGRSEERPSADTGPSGP